MTSEIDEGSYLEPSKCRVGKWLDIRLNEYTENIKPFTKYPHLVTIKNHLKPAFGYVRLSELNTVMVQAFLNNLVRSKAEGARGLSPNAAINIHSIFHRATISSQSGDDPKTVQKNQGKNKGPTTIAKIRILK
ncbi:hypothetical protein [Candidatus Agathobaculum pullicola]|uniref:hypothetical protein n=1 Tax=Candidatus Agathobaculum pullicola TaxID=2838426 RepID=UPI003F8F732A